MLKGSFGQPILRPVKFRIEMSLDVCVPATAEIHNDQRMAIEKAASIINEIRSVFPKYRQFDESGIEFYIPTITLQCLIEPE